jgi:hypothetical protein
VAFPHCGHFSDGGVSYVHRDQCFVEKPLNGFVQPEYGGLWLRAQPADIAPLLLQNIHDAEAQEPSQ